MIVLFNADGTGWINVESIETLNVMPVDSEGELSPFGDRYGVFADRPNSELFIVAVKETLEEARNVLMDITTDLEMLPIGDDSLVWTEGAEVIE